MAFIYFIRDLVYNCQKDDIFATANQITYRLVTSLFPFIAFLLSLIGFFNFDVRFLMTRINEVLPAEIMEVLSVFVREIVETKNTSMLTMSVGVLLLNASAGYQAVAKGFCRSYNLKEKRSFFRLRIMGVLFVPFFAIIIIISALLLIFGDKLMSLMPVNWYEQFYFLFGFTKYLVALLIIQISVAIIYKLTLPISLPYIYHVPGSILTAIIWVVSTKFFNIYVNNYSNHSVIYGSVASLFILMLWLNMISIVLLIGTEFNALLYRRFEKNDSILDERLEKDKMMDTAHEIENVDLKRK